MSWERWNLRVTDPLGRALRDCEGLFRRNQELLVENERYRALLRRCRPLVEDLAEQWPDDVNLARLVEVLNDTLRETP